MDDLAILWIDSHPDIGTQASEYPGFHAMAVAALNAAPDLPADRESQTCDPSRATCCRGSATRRGPLATAEQFAAQSGLQPWDADPTAEPPYHRDLFPDHCYSEASRRFASMAQAAWVFGGMGSWNDLGFSEPEIHSEFEQISRDLFAAVMLACVASANADLATP